MLLIIKCALIFYTNLSETFLILRRIERDMIKVYTGLRVKYPLFLSQFIENRISSQDFRKMLKLSNVTKTLPVGAELFHAGFVAPVNKYQTRTA
jgi:hypothetical protein